MTGHFILYRLVKIPLMGFALALTAHMTSLISGQNVISDNERKFVSLSRNTFEV